MLCYFLFILKQGIADAISFFKMNKKHLDRKNIS